MKPEMVPVFRSLQRKFKSAYESSSARPRVSRYALHFGDGNGTVFRRVQPFDSWAEMGQFNGRGVLREVLGEEEDMSIGATTAQSLEGRERYVVQFRPELSRLPEGTTSNE